MSSLLGRIGKTAFVLSVPALATAGYVHQVSEENGENPVKVVAQKSLAGMVSLGLSGVSRNLGLDIKVTPRKIEPAPSTSKDNGVGIVLEELKHLREDSKKSALALKEAYLDDKERRINSGSYIARSACGGLLSTAGAVGMGAGIFSASFFTAGVGGVALGLGLVFLGSAAIDESAAVKK